MLPDLYYLRTLAEAIRGLHGASVLHVQTTAVGDADDARWTGNVEVFALIGPTEARRCFAWPNSDGDAVVLLATPDIATPEQAVRAYLSSRSS